MEPPTLPGTPAERTDSHRALLRWLILANAPDDDLRELSSDPPPVDTGTRGTAFDLVFAPAGAFPS